jgi:dipeptidyl aminopeptidase/acylaminoacyl peptidase
MFTTPVEGPFPGEGWNKWVGHDLSGWWLSDIPIETVTIPVSDEVTLEAWWIKASYPTAQETVIVTHGYGTSRRDYNAILPSAMLAKEGFNVLLVDQRDTGNSTCVDGRHSAGQDESDDFAAVADWLIAEKGITADKIGMFGVSGGAIATAILPAKTDNVAAFAMEAPIFDFAETARKEVEFQGFPGVLWGLADIAAKLRGVDLNATPIPAGIDAAGNRPMLLLHGTDDQRLAYEGAVEFRDYAENAGVEITLETFEGADHTEGMLTETDRYANALTTFFRNALGQAG